MEGFISAMLILALLNWRMARETAAKFLIRIEDIDVFGLHARACPAALG